MTQTQTDIAPGAEYWAPPPPPAVSQPVLADGPVAPRWRFLNQTVGLIVLLVGTSVLYLWDLGASGDAND